MVLPLACYKKALPLKMKTTTATWEPKLLVSWDHVAHASAVEGQQ
jgi:hypothetical protein